MSDPHLQGPTTAATFTSFSWLHSLHSPSTPTLFRSLPLLIPTGIFTALLAFSIIRLELLLSGLKYGLCLSSWIEREEFCGDWWRPRKGARYALYVAVGLGWAVAAVAVTVFFSESRGRFMAVSSEAASSKAASSEAASSKAASSKAAPSKAALNERSALLRHPDVHVAEAEAGVQVSPALPQAPPRAPSEASLQARPQTPSEVSLQARPQTPSEASLQTSQKAWPQTKPAYYYAAGSGVPELKCILSGYVIHSYLGLTVLLSKSLGLALSVASGLSLGKEGPMVQIAACVGNLMCRVHGIKNEAQKRAVISSAAAAGVAVAFGSPLGGVLFSMEEVSMFYPASTMFRAFICASVAALTLKLLDPFGTGQTVVFEVSFTQQWHTWEMPIFMLLGVFGGLFGAAFVRANSAWAALRKSYPAWPRSPFIEVVVVTLVSISIGYWNTLTRMGGSEMVALLFSECKSTRDLHGYCTDSEPIPVVISLALAMVFKALITVVTFGSLALPHGIFVPTLAIGACAGRIVGLGVEHAIRTWPDLAVFNVCKGQKVCTLPAIYALIGAASCLSGVTRMTISLAVIIAELTNSLAYTVPAMVAIVVSRTVASAIEPHGIYDANIQSKNLPFLDNRIRYDFGGSDLHDVLDDNAICLDIDETISLDSLSSKIIQVDERTGGKSDDYGFPIIKKSPGSSDRPEEKFVIGCIQIPDISRAASIMAKGPSESPRTSFFLPNSSHLMMESRFSLNSQSLEDGAGLAHFIDYSPITVTINSPLYVVHELFVKLGIKQLMVVDNVRRTWLGMIHKNEWIAYLRTLTQHDE